MAIFLSKFSFHAISVVPGDWKFDKAGTKITIPGKQIVFLEGKFETDDPKEIGFLRQRPEYGNVITEPSREKYAEEIKEKVIKPEPANNPVVKAEMERIAKAEALKVSARIGKK